MGDLFSRRAPICYTGSWITEYIIVAEHGLYTRRVVLLATLGRPTSSHVLDYKVAPPCDLKIRKNPHANITKNTTPFNQEIEQSTAKTKCAKNETKNFPNVLGRARTGLSLLDKQEMHRSICNDDKDPGDYGEANHIVPESKGVETEGAQDRGSRNFNVQAILVVDQGEEGDLVDNKGFKAIVED